MIRVGRPKESRGPRVAKTLYLNPDDYVEFEAWLRRTHSRMSVSEYFNKHMENVLEEDEKKQQQRINELEPRLNLSAIRSSTIQPINDDGFSMTSYNETMDKYIKHVADSSDKDEINKIQGKAWVLHDFGKSKYIALYKGRGKLRKSSDIPKDKKLSPEAAAVLAEAAAKNLNDFRSVGDIENEKIVYQHGKDKNDTK
jgi:transposase